MGVASEEVAPEIRRGLSRDYALRNVEAFV